MSYSEEKVITFGHLKEEEEEEEEEETCSDNWWAFKIRGELTI